MSGLGSTEGACVGRKNASIPTAYGARPLQLGGRLDRMSGKILRNGRTTISLAGVSYIWYIYRFLLPKNYHMLRFLDRIDCWVYKADS